MRKQGIDGTGMLNLYDRVTGIFNEIFDARLLTVALFALEGYCCPLHPAQVSNALDGLCALWHDSAFVCHADGAHAGQTRARALSPRHGGAVVALHGMMVISGLFYQDWLPESVPLLICYPVVFSVFASRDDESTFRSILRGAVFAVLPFLVWSYATVR